MLKWTEINNNQTRSNDDSYPSSYEVQGVNRTAARKDKEYHNFRNAKIKSLVSKIPELSDERIKASIRYQKYRGSYPEYLKALIAEKERREE